MDTSSHDLNGLFLQLGLATSSKAVEAFIKNNHLPSHIKLEQAAIWSAGQAQFIHEAMSHESDWSEVVDQLDAQLRH